MTETLVVPDKTKAFDDWLSALRSGEYEQGFGALCMEEEHGRYHCCIGVLDEVVFDTTWSRYYGSKFLINDEGEESNIGAAKAAVLGLDKHLTENEVEILSGYYIGASVIDTRLAALALLNDTLHVDFDTIAMLIEDTLGWNRV